MERLAHMKKRLRTGARWLAAPLLLLFLLSGLPAAAAREGYVDNKLNIVTEPGESSSYVSFYKNGKKASQDDMTWTDNGRHGKALVLDGVSEYLQIPETQMKLAAFSFTAWINWQGAKDPAAADGFYGQRLFTVAKGTTNWFTLSPHMRDPSKTDDTGRILDGVYLGYNYGGNKGTLVEEWTPAADGTEAYGLPTGEWHHLAAVTTGREMRLYIDGRLWQSKTLVASIAELRASNMKIGAGFDGGPYLNALLDDVAVYETALDESQIVRAMEGLDPFSSDPVPSVTEPSHPTEPADPTTVFPFTTTAPGLDLNQPSPLFGIPMWSMILILVLLSLFVLLSVVLSILEVYGRRKGAGGPKK